jgi:membrane protein
MDVGAGRNGATPMIAGRFRLPISWVDVARRTVREIGDDNCLGLAAQLAFYFLLALFPALLFLVALISYVPSVQALEKLLFALGAVAPRELVHLIRDQLDLISGGGHAGLLTIGVGGALWSSSAAMVAIIDALNRAYDVAEWRAWWRRRLLAIALTLALALFIVCAFALVLIGPDLAVRIADWLGIARIAAIAWSIARWPVMVSCVVLGVDLVYHFAPNRPARWAWITPGSVLATALWIVSSFGFKFYVTSVGDYAATYGAIAGTIVVMLWFYVSGLAILVGAELNGVIESARRAAPPRPSQS